MRNIINIDDTFIASLSDSFEALTGREKVLYLMKQRHMTALQINE